MPTDISQESLSFFDEGGRPGGALLPLQVEPNAPQVNGLETITGPILPDRSILDRLAHMPDELYDLRETSHLVRLMKALLGDSGVGQLRHRNLVAQFQIVMQGTHFYDLDRFYGAIFGISRTIGELLWISPDADLATANEWDQIQDRDAAFRDRISHLAAAINMGATYPGIQSAAEALVGVECDVYEVWDLLDTFGSGSLGRTWNDIEAVGNWEDVEAMDPSPLHPNWTELSNVTTVGRTGTNSRSEVIVRPKKDYARIRDEEGELEGNRIQAEDEHSIIRVLNVIKPASVLLTVDPDGVALHHEAPIAGLQADSNYWSVSTRVTPRPDLVSPIGNPYPLSLQQALQGILASDRREVPKPPWAVQQAAQWSYAPETVAVRSYAFETGADDDYTSPGDGPITDRSSDDVVTYRDGTRERFTADRGALDPRRALAARYASEGILVANPYSGPRPSQGSA